MLNEEIYMGIIRILDSKIKNTEFVEYWPADNRPYIRYFVYKNKPLAGETHETYCLEIFVVSAHRTLLYSIILDKNAKKTFYMGIEYKNKKVFNYPIQDIRKILLKHYNLLMGNMYHVKH